MDASWEDPASKPFHLKELEVHAVSGFTAMVVSIGSFGLGLLGLVAAVSSESVFLGFLAVVCGIMGFLGLIGLFTVSPNQARILQLFGEYKGTVKAPGLRW